MSLAPGTRVGAYEVLAKIGEGGMGEVYRARDSRLKRDVALKILPESFAADPERLARFHREAEVLASLNHPNIAAIHGVEESGDTRALVLELVEGPTLADRIARGPVPVEEALSIARQIAEAFEAAHERGIIHRDLKPANVKMRDDCTVKVLDFGLAKAADLGAAGEPRRGDGTPAALSQSPTMMSPAMVTGAGVILGTAAYMAPEQARGKAVDRRVDLWAFGCVLYEMLAGRRAFGGDDVSSTIASILRDDVKWDALPANLPDPLLRLLRRCLEKDVRRRLSAMSDARLELEDAFAGGTNQSTLLTAATQSPWRIAPAAGAAAIAAAAIASLATWALMRPAPLPSAPVARFAVNPPSSLPLQLQGLDRDVAIAPDGSFLVYRSARGQLAIRRFDRLDATAVEGASNARQPAVSPDGRWIAFVQRSEIVKVPVSGGRPVRLATLDFSSRGLSWIDDATIVVATNSSDIGLMSVPAAGGEPTVLTRPDRSRGEVGHWLPSLVPDRAVLFTAVTERLEDSQIDILDLDTGQRTMLVHGGTNPLYTASGHLLYAAGDSLMAVRFDSSQRAVSGDVVRVAENVAVTPVGVMHAVVSSTGTLVYVPADADVSNRRLLTWVDRQGRETSLPAPPRAYNSARLSPDGTRIALGINDQQSDVWVWEIARQTLTRITFDPALDSLPIWTPDGRRIVFMSYRGGPSNLYARAADGSGTDVRLSVGAADQQPGSISPDGAFVIGNQAASGAGFDVVRFLMAVDGTNERGAAERSAEVLVATRFNDRNADISPDGRLLAYQSDESGEMEIYVRPYPRVTEGRWQVSTDGGTHPTWTRGGRELVFLDAEDRLTAASVETTGTAVLFGTPERLFTTAYATGAFRPYDASPDGRRFLMMKNAPGPDGTPQASSFIVVQGWFEELNRLVPAGR